MPLRYDFDMFSFVPKDLQVQSRDHGVPADVAGEQIALWRDPGVVNALRGADPDVQRFFKESGFGLNVYDSGAPRGQYPAYDEVARIGVIERLTTNMSRFDLANANLNGFDFGAFLECVVSAEPWDEPGMGLPLAGSHQRRGAATFGPADEVGRNGAASGPGGAQRKRGLIPALGLVSACALYLVIWQGAAILNLGDTVSIAESLGIARAEAGD